MIKYIKAFFIGGVIGVIAGLFFSLIGCKSESIMAVQVFPESHKEQFKQAYAEAYSIVTKVEGTPKKRGLHGKLKPCTKNFDGYWAWYEQNAEYSEWVMGITGDYGRTITAGVDPHGNVHHGMLVHEMVHHLRIVTWGKYDHDPRYDGIVFNWSGARTVYGKQRNNGFIYDKVKQ